MMKRSFLNKEEIFSSFSLILLLLLTFGSFFQREFNILGIFLSQLLLIFLPTMGLMYFFKLNFDILKLKKTKWQFYIGAISFWLLSFIGIFIFSIIQVQIFPISSESLKGLNLLVLNATKFEVIFYLSLAPAICEEIFFRGFIYGNLEKITSNKNAMLISSILFGLFHIHPAKIISTTLLGLSFVYIVHLTKSIYPAILMHFINNFFVIYISRSPDFIMKDYYIYLLIIAIFIFFYYLKIIIDK